MTNSPLPTNWQDGEDVDASWYNQVGTNVNANSAALEDAVATPSADGLVVWDTNKNLSANAVFQGAASTPTAAGITTLTITSPQVQIFTGSTTQTVRLPTTGVPLGGRWLIINRSSGAVAVQASNQDPIVSLASNTASWFTALQATPTGATGWVQA